MSISLPTTLGALDRQRYAPIGIRDELRRNLRAALRDGQELFPGIVGYEHTVLPQLANAVLARHDIILLGLRGQAKTRIARLLPALLDEWRPMIADTPLREHPLAPVSDAARALIDEAGDDTPISWLHREERYGEKLATPDVTVADLIGDVDPLKAAHQQLDLSDERVIHYGIIPRTNHGIFCINELPDLAPRIQVALLNVLEEQDIQIRGFPLRIPLDVLMIFTANPEDYTNRGSIITPLKDRIASQIATHYPPAIAQARSITESEAWLDRSGGPTVSMPDRLAEIIEGIAFHGRQSEYIDQKSGVSARLSIAARELVHSQVERRWLVCGPDEPPVPRLLDLMHCTPAIIGKVELVYEGEQEGAAKVAHHLIGRACRDLFDERFPRAIETDDEPTTLDDTYQPILAWFASGRSCDLDDVMPFNDHIKTLNQVDGLAAIAAEHLQAESDAELALGMELILEGLHQHSLISKTDRDTGASYGDMLRSMLGSV